MKTTFRIAGILLLVTGLIFTGCKKDSKSTPIDIQSIMCGTNFCRSICFARQRRS